MKEGQQSTAHGSPSPPLGVMNIMRAKQKMTGVKQREKFPEWSFGIDFGTSNTYVVAYEANEQIYLGKKLFFEDFAGTFANGTDASEDDYNIPTRVTFNADGAQGNPTMLIGAEAKRHPILRIFSGLKQAARRLTPPDGKFGEGEAKPREYPFRQCDPETPLQFGNADLPIVHSVHDLLVDFFKKILHIGDDKLHVDKTTVRGIVIGRPANTKVDESTDSAYEETLKDILTECFLGKDPTTAEHEDFKKKIDVIQEPILAGEAYLYGDGQSEKRVLVIDIGGGTTDFAIVHYGTDSGKDTEIEVDGSASCEIAGNAIDSYIFDLLPNGFPKSKENCTRAKEGLFAENSTGNLGQWKGENLAVFYDDETKDKAAKDYILLKEGSLFLGGKRVKRYVMDAQKPKAIDIEDGKNDHDRVEDVGIEEIIYKPIWNKLEAMLTKWQEPPKDKSKRKSQDKKIVDTIFFVGGASIIKPLRDYLTKEVCNFFGIPVEEKEEEIEIKGDLTVETLFGKNQRKLEVAGDSNLIKITSYNAVAIGACIKAIDDGKCAIKPEVSFSWIHEDDERNQVFRTDEGHIILSTSGEVVPTSCIFVEKGNFDVLLRAKQNSINKKLIRWTIGRRIHSWKIETMPGETAVAVLKKAIAELKAHKVIAPPDKAGALIVLSQGEERPQCKFYLCRQPRYWNAETETYEEPNIENFISIKKDDIRTVISEIKGCEIALEYQSCEESYNE